MKWRWWGRRDQNPVPTPSAPPAPPEPAWSRVPQLQRMVPLDLRPVAPLDRFTSGLTAYQNPSMLGDLGHLVDRTGPSGQVTGLAVPRPAPSVPSRTISYSSVQRQAMRTADEAPVSSSDDQFTDQFTDDRSTGDQFAGDHFSVDEDRVVAEHQEVPADDQLLAVDQAAAEDDHGLIGSDHVVAAAHDPVDHPAPAAQLPAVGSPPAVRNTPAVGQQPATPHAHHAAVQRHAADDLPVHAATDLAATGTVRQESAPQPSLQRETVDDPRAEPASDTGAPTTAGLSSFAAAITSITSDLPTPTPPSDAPNVPPAIADSTPAPSGPPPGLPVHTGSPVPVPIQRIGLIGSTPPPTVGSVPQQPVVVQPMSSTGSTATPLSTEATALPLPATTSGRSVEAGPVPIQRTVAEPEAVRPISVQPASDLEIVGTGAGAKEDDLSDRAVDRPVPVEPMPLTILPLSVARSSADAPADPAASSSSGWAGASGQPGVQRLTEAVALEPVSPTWSSELPATRAAAATTPIPTPPVVAQLSSQAPPLLHEPRLMRGQTGPEPAGNEPATPSVQKISYEHHGSSPASRRGSSHSDLAPATDGHDQRAGRQHGFAASSPPAAVGSLLEPVQRWTAVSEQEGPTRDAVQPLEPLSSPERMSAPERMLAPGPMLAPEPMLGPEPVPVREPLPVVHNQLAPMGESDYTPLSAVSFDRPAGASVSIPSVAVVGGPNVQRTTTPTPPSSPTPAMPIHVVQPAAVQPAAVQPAVVQPAVVQPAAVQPAAVQPAAVQPAAVQPAAVQPAAVKPAAVQRAAAPTATNLPVHSMARSSAVADSNGGPVSFATMFGPATSSAGPVDLPVQRAADAPVPTQDPGQSAPAAPPQDPAPSQPFAAAAPASASAAGSAGGENLDELARRLFEPLSTRLKAELWLDRERAGLITDARP